MEILIVFLAGLASGFMGATIGSGSLITMPVLLFLGLPPHIAVATDKYGDIGAFAAAVNKYRKANKIVFKISCTLTLIAVIGTLIGTRLFLLLNAQLLKSFIGVFMLIFVPFALLDKRFGLRKKCKSKKMIFAGLALYFALSLISAVTGGAGGATVALFLMVSFLGFGLVEGYATNAPSELFQACLSAVMYFFYGFVDFRYALILIISGFTGGYFGARAALRMKIGLIIKLYIIAAVLISVWIILS